MQDSNTDFQIIYSNSESRFYDTYTFPSRPAILLRNFSKFQINFRRPRDQS